MGTQLDEELKSVFENAVSFYDYGHGDDLEESDELAEIFYDLAIIYGGSEANDPSPVLFEDDEELQKMYDTIQAYQKQTKMF